MKRKSVKIRLDMNNDRDRKINEYLDHQSSISETIKLLLLLAIKRTGNKDFKSSIIDNKIGEVPHSKDSQKAESPENQEQKKISKSDNNTEKVEAKKDNPNKFNFFDNDNFNDL